MEEKYTINVGDFTTPNTEQTYTNRCLSASIGGDGIYSDYIPWENTQYNPWDYKYENGQFVLDVIEIPSPTHTPSNIDRIEAQTMYTALMTDTLLGG